MRVIRLDDAEAEHGPCGPWEGIALIRNWREYYSNAFRERPMTDAAGKRWSNTLSNYELRQSPPTVHTVHAQLQRHQALSPAYGVNVTRLALRYCASTEILASTHFGGADCVFPKSRTRTRPCFPV